MIMKIKHLILSSVIAVSALGLTGCNSSSSSFGAYRSPYISATQFVNGLNAADNTYPDSEIVLYQNETVRSTWDSEDWFVIYDGLRGEYKAVSLQYVRSIVYYAYYSNSYDLAQEFRDIEEEDMAYGFYDGDAYGEDYEDVTYNSFDGFFYGETTGYRYEDEVETHDVNLVASEKEEMALYEKVSKISYTYKVSLETATQLAKLGEKVEVMLKKGDAQEELTAEDQAILTQDIEKIAGVTIEEVAAAELNNEAKTELMNKISTKMGTTPQQLEDHILPELLGVQ
tara:strand:- start:144052 stop:144903 length:852 start_codon:yes stop_codon:yes gene_type:complete